MNKEPRILSYEESIKLMSQYGIPVARGNVATSLRDANMIAEELGYPVALKVLSPQIPHKIDAGIIKLNVTKPSFEKSYEGIVGNAAKLKTKIRGVLVQEMVQDGTEIIIGSSRDPQFGPIILFGLGGIFVEVLKDVSLRLPPLSRFDVQEMIKEINGYKILCGYRGKPRADLTALADILLKASKLVVDLKDTLLEMDINPLLLFQDGRGAKAVDVRVVFEETNCA